MLTEDKTYTFEELSDEAKENAREWWRRYALDDEWWEGVFAYCDTAFDIIGINTSEYRNRAGLLARVGPDIQFSGFGNQGDGASFAGVYHHQTGAGERIRDHAPLDKELHRIVDTLQALQFHHDQDIWARIERTGRGCHEYSVSIDVYWREDDDVLGKVGDMVAELLRDLMRWVYARLEEEYNYLLSDEVIDEALINNEYEFSEEGKRI